MLVESSQVWQVATTSVIQIFFGTAPRDAPKILPTGNIELLGATVPVNRLIVIGIAAIVLLAFAAFFQRSRHGVAMRAVADDQQAALTMGISVRRVFSLAWVLAAVSALIAGVLLADLSAVSQNIAAFGLIVFPVVILGGLDSIMGAIVGGILIGVFENLSGGYLDPLFGGGVKEVAPFAALVLILMLRPHGLFGKVEIERV